MTIEKAFAIKASPYEIYAALERDLDAASAHDGDTFQVLRRDPGRSIDLRVTMSGVPCWLIYRLDAKPEHTEVVATLTPFGLRYLFFQMITLGLRGDTFAVPLVQGLVNLKEEVEGTAGALDASTDDQPGDA